MLATYPKFIRWLVWLAISVGLMCLIAFNVLVVWVATGPRSLTQFIPTLEKQISEAQQRFDIDIGDGVLLWDGWQHPIDIRLKDIKLYTKQGILFASFPEISMGLDIPALFTGKFLPNSIVLHRPIINLYRRDDGEITIDFGQDLTQGPYLPTSEPAPKIKPLAEMLSQAGISGLFDYLDRVEITDATVSLGDTRKGSLLTAQQVNLQARHLLGDVDLTLSGQLEHEGSHSAFYVQASVPLQNLAASLKVTVDGLAPARLAPLLPSITWLSGIDVPLYGWLNLVFTAEGRVEEAAFVLSAQEGVVDLDLLEAPFPVTMASIEGARTSQGIWQIEKFTMTSKGREFSGRVSMWTDAHNRPGLIAHGLAKNIPADDISILWPPSLAPISREWVVESLTEGMSPHAALEVNIKPGELEQERLPDKSIQAAIQFVNMDVEYKEGHPKVTDARGVVYVNANQLVARIESGNYMSGTRLAKGVVEIDDLIVDNPRIKVAFDVQTPLADAARFLALPDLDLAEELNISPDSVSGAASGHATVAFDYFAPRDAEGNLIEEELANYTVKGTLSDVVVPKLLGKYNVAKGEGGIDISNEKVEFAGSAEIYGAPAKLAVTHRFHAGNEPHTELKVQANMTTETLKNMEYDVGERVSGTLGINASVKQYDASEQITATLDLGQAVVGITEIGWQKPAGIAATLSFAARSDEQQTQVSDIVLKGEDMQFEGTAVFDAAMKELRAVQAQRFHMGRNDLIFTYEVIPGGHKFHGSGASLDLSEWFKEDEDGDDGFSQKDIPALDVSLDLETIHMAEDTAWIKPKGFIRCGVEICQAVDIKSWLGSGKSFEVTISGSGGKRKLVARSDSAGEFLRSLGIYEQMEGGTLHLDADFHDKEEGRPLVGKLWIREFRIQDAPVLARMLTLASFTGVLDMLSGNGVSFERLFASFSLANDVITVVESKNTGPSLGITAEGIIHLAESRLSLKGAIVPSYTINSFLKNVPLVGEILTGGEGIIAALYTMEGPLKDPKISVNPLSVLTPGFLRRLFEG